MAQLFLAKHAFVCETAAHGVFLDLKRDAYSTVTEDDLVVLRAAVVGWPSKHGASGTSSNESIIRELLKNGLLTESAERGKDAQPVSVAEPRDSFVEGARSWPFITPEHLHRMRRAWLTVTLQLRVMPLRLILRRVQRRKERIAHCASEIDPRAIYGLVNVYLALQPAFFCAKDACLRNSLTLVEYLRLYGIYPDLVFGVVAEPFDAHAWTRIGSTLLVDPVEHVKRYTPIMQI